MKKIMITGGHLTPALAVMTQLKARGWECVYVGRKHALEGDKALSQEMQVVSKHGIKFIPLITGRLQRWFSLAGIISLLKIPVGLVQAIFALLKYRPQVVLSFGGYMAVPVVVGAWVLGTPVVTHEQTVTVGLANKIIGLLAKKICVGWPGISYPFDADKIVNTGNPLRPEIFKTKKSFKIDLTKPLVYITGGSLGSHQINLAVESSLEKLLEKYAVIHQCGNSQEFYDYEHLVKQKENLPANLNSRYLPIKYVDEEHIGWVLGNADVLVSRAGANTITEIIALTKPALLIPLPWAGSNEQEKNARYLVDHGAAMILGQGQLTTEKLLENLEELFKNQESIRKNLHQLSSQLPPNAAVLVADVVESVA